jgi:hypothetical protein
VLYKYDQAICDNLKASLTDEANKNVFLTDADNYPGIIAQIQNDTISYPLILLHRDEDTPVITELMNFTRYKKGVPCVFDNKKNNVYYERALPVQLNYTLRILSHNVADTDELARELFYKYLSMYFLTIQLPYESDRKIRFGVQVDADYGIKRESGSGEYLASGALYQSTMRLLTQGCVSITYTPRHVNRTVINTKEIKIENPTPNPQG